MKIICTQENLKSGLWTTSKIIPQTNTLPILNNLLLKTENGLLKISSTNLELAISTHIRCKVEQEGQTTVIAKPFSELVNNLTNTNLILETKEGELHIQNENQKFKIKTLPADEFPFIPTPTNTKHTTVNKESLKISINQVVFAASTNQTQPEISGVLLTVKNKKIKLVATDRYRLAEKVVEEEVEGEAEVIIPQKCAQELARILNTSTENPSFAVNDNQIFFTIGPTQIVSRLIEGQYPDYQSIIPTQFTTTINTERGELYNAIKANALFAQSGSSVKVEYDSKKQELIISSETQDLGGGTVKLSAQVEGSGGSLFLNSRYILDFLTQVTEERIIIKVVNDSSPAVFIPDGQKGYTYLVMPIKI